MTTIHSFHKQPALTPEQEKMVLIGETFKELDLSDRCVIHYLLGENILRDHNLCLSGDWDEDQLEVKEIIEKDRDMVGLAQQFLRQSFFVKKYNGDD